MTRAPYARVLVESPLPQLDRLFDYEVPDHWDELATPGVRVRVPLRSAGRVVSGYLVERTAELDFTGPVSPIEEVVSAVPVLAPEVYTLVRTLADRAAGVASDLIRVAIPKRQVRVEKAWLASGGVSPASPFTPAEVEGYGPEQLEGMLRPGARTALDVPPGIVELDGPTGGATVGAWARALGALASRALAQGSVILAVPDYRDQDQLLAVLARLLPADRVVRVDADQSGPDRYRALLSGLGPEPRVFVGNRSAVYVPAARLALIAIWDDGDPLLAEPLAPYVHARDAALVRTAQQGNALLFAAHSRSTEVQRLIELGWLEEVRPLRRVRPRVVPTAMQATGELQAAAAARIPSSAWKGAREAVARGPVLLQVARPGYSPGFACAECGESARCAACGGALARRTSRAAVRCLVCGTPAHPWACPYCRSQSLVPRGQGAERTAEDLGRAFPQVPVIVADGERRLQTVAARPALVIATRGAEPVAEGGYRAVLLLDGERMLARESLRVAEDCLRWWSNAAALAADDASIYLVGVAGRLATAFASWNHSEFLARELADRRALRFPPAVRVATVSGSAVPVREALEAVQNIAGLDVLGPVPLEDEQLRATLRFDYPSGPEIARELKAVVVANATRRRRPGPPPRLRIRMDDVEPFG